MDDNPLRSLCKRVAGLVGSVNHAANVSNQYPDNESAHDWWAKKRAELHAAEDELAALLAVRKDAR